MKTLLLQVRIPNDVASGEGNCSKIVDSMNKAEVELERIGTLICDKYPQVEIKAIFPIVNMMIIYVPDMIQVTELVKLCDCKVFLQVYPI